MIHRIIDLDTLWCLRVAVSRDGVRTWSLTQAWADGLCSYGGSGWESTGAPGEQPKGGRGRG